MVSEEPETMHFNSNQKQFRLSKFSDVGNFNLDKNVDIVVKEENLGTKISAEAAYFINNNEQHYFYFHRLMCSQIFFEC